MSKIIGVTVGTPVPQSDWNQTDPNRADYIKNKPDVANALKGSAEGNPIRLDDVSPLEHEMAAGLRSKNLLQYPYKHTTKTENGITFTDNGDGTITANGTATADAMFYLNVFTILQGVYYYISGCPQGGSYSTYDFEISGFKPDFGDGQIVSHTKNFETSARIYVRNGQTVSNLVFKPQIELGTTATAYTPFVDVNGASVQKYGKNLCEDVTLNGVTITGDGKSNYIHQKLNAHFPDSDTPVTVSMKFTAKDIVFSSNGLLIFCGVSYTDGTTDYLGLVSTDNYTQGFGSFTVNKKIVRIDISQQVRWKGGTITIDYIQVEEGTTATEYEHFVEPTTYTADENGIVKGIIGNGEAMTLIADSGAIISADYNKDTKKYIDKKFAELQALILEV